MATHNIGNKIICDYQENCNKYCNRMGDGKFSKCINCKNNKYSQFANPEKMKRNYYRPNDKTFIYKILDRRRKIMEVIAETEEYTKIDEEWVRACMEEERTDCSTCPKNQKECLEKLISMCG